MEVVPLRPEHLDTLAEIYRQTTAAAAHCRFYPSAEQFNRSLTHPAREETRIFVAEATGAAQGFAALLPPRAAEDGVEEARITALFVRDEEPGFALLDACLAQPHGARRVLAFPDSHERCPITAYNAGWDGLSDRLAVVARVLVRRGFAPTYRELHLECVRSRFPLTVAPKPNDVEIVERSTSEGEFVLTAMAGEQEVGTCGCFTVNRFSDHPEAARWGYVTWLHVAESQRRRGLARHLMTRVLLHLRDRDCQGCWLTTGAANWPAQPLYLGLGFEIVDASACFQKTLADPPPTAEPLPHA